MELTFVELLTLSFALQALIYTLLLIGSNSVIERALDGSRRYGCCEKILAVSPLLSLLTASMFFMYNIPDLASITLALSISTYMLTRTMLGERFPQKVFIYSLTLLPLLALTVMGSTYPSIEEGRHLGFAESIISKGHWYPFTFEDNDYYQFFHMTANYLALQIIITGANPFILRKVYVVTVSIFILIIASVASRKVIRTDNDHIAPLLVIISASLAHLFTIYGNGTLGTVIALFAIVILLSITSRYLISIIALISIIGVLTHPLYSFYLIPFLTMLVIFSRELGRRRFYGVCLLIVVMITALYWTFSVVLKTILIKVIADYWSALINFFAQPLRESAAYTPWYENLSFYNRLFLGFSWTLMPSLAISYLVAKLVKQLMSGKLSFEFMFRNRTSLLTLYSFAMLGAPILWYLIMKKPLMGLGFSHFYGLFFLLAPAASAAILSMGRQHRVLPLVAILVFVGIAAYGVMQDPHYNPTSPALGLSTERDWIVGTTISKLTGHDTISQGDFRLASPSLYIATLEGGLKYQFTQSSEAEKTYLLTVAYDAKGIACVERAYFFLGHPELGKHILVQNYEPFNVVYNDGFYRSLLVKLRR